MKRIGEVAGRDAIAVGPLGIGPQVKGVPQAVGRNLPPRRHARNALAGFLIVAGEPFEERDHDVHVGRRVHDVRIDRGRFVLVAEVQRAGAQALGDRRFPPAAAASGQQGPEHREHHD